MIGWLLAGYIGCALLKPKKENPNSSDVRLISEERRRCGEDDVIFRTWSYGTTTVTTVTYVE